MIKFMLSQYTSEDGKTVYQVMCNGSPIMAETLIRDEAEYLLAYNIQLERMISQSPIEVSEWNGDAGTLKIRSNI